MFATHQKRGRAGRSRRRLRFARDQSGVSEVVGMMLSVMLTFALFTLLAVSVFALAGSRPAAQVVMQGTVYANGSGMVLSHAGGDPVPASGLQVRVFINQSLAYSPGFAMLTQSYAPDTDGKWNFGDRLLVYQNVSAGSTVEVVLVDQMTHNTVGRITLDVRRI